VTDGGKTWQENCDLLAGWQLQLAGDPGGGGGGGGRDAAMQRQEEHA